MSSANKQMGVQWKKKTNPLNKRIPKNPRYKHVKSVLDTGESMTRYVEKMDEIRHNYRFRPGEIFKRLKCVTFANMVLQVFTFTESENDLCLNDTADGAGSLPDEGDVADPLASPGRTTAAQVVHGIGEKDGTTDSAADQDPLDTIPFLVLDVRDKDAYDECHIITARSYPAARLTRSCNYFTPEILRYKNVPGKVIILYDEDERIATGCAATFVQRDVDNVFMLSGGLKVLTTQFPDGMLMGKLPESLRQPPSRSTSRSTTTAASRTATATSKSGTARPPVGARSKPINPEEDRPVSRPLVSLPPQTPRSLAPYPGWFTVDDVQSIEDTLDQILLDGDHSGSRATPSRSSKSSAASRATGTPSGRPATQRSAGPPSSRAARSGVK